MIPASGFVPPPRGTSTDQRSFSVRFSTVMVCHWYAGLSAGIGEGHLRSVVREWASHYNRGRRYAALRSVPEPTPGIPAGLQINRHQLPAGQRVLAKTTVGGLHHEYSL